MRKFINICCYLLLLLSLLSDVSAQTDTSVSPMLATEKAALYSLIQAFAGNTFNGSELYPDPCGWTPIQGFSCDLFDGLWYVTVASIGPIHENSLECTPNAQLSHFLFEFKHLKSLSFFNCFHHPITITSQSWEKLAGSLETLEFRSNPGITGEIPSSLGSLTNLISLVLIENSLKGELPTCLGNLGRLKQLVLAENRFSGQIPASLGGLQELLILDLSRNSLSGTLPSTFGGLFSLLKLDLNSNFLDGKLPTELGQLRNLTLLDLRYNKFSGGLPPSLQEMVSLEEMLMGNNPIGGNLVESGWGELKNLIIMDLSNMGLTGNIPESIAEMKTLRFLAMDNNNLSGNLSPKLAALPCLNALYVNSNNLTGELEFSEDFYSKMGRRFCVWSNPYLCFPVGFGHVPFGVKLCERKASVASSTVLKTEVGGGNSDQEDSNMAFGNISGSFSEGFCKGFWWTRLLSLFILYLLL